VFGGVTYLSAVLGRAVRGVSGAIIVAATAVVGAIGMLWITSHMFSAIVGLVAAAIVAGVVYAVTNALATPGGEVYNAHNNSEVEIAALYWHFVDLIWILVFTFVYLI
jgi:hypothetical protein